MNSYKILFAITVVLFACVGISSAAEDTDERTGLFGEKFHNPAPWLELSGDFRFRTRYQNIYGGFQNKQRPDSERLRFPIRTRLRAKIKFSEDMDFNIGNVWLLTHWVRPKSADSSRRGTFNNGNEGAFDAFNLKVRNVFDLPLTLTVGRQDLFFGKGWLVAEGTPLDASKTGYFDALRATYELDRDSIFDFVYIDQKSSSDARLKPINNDESSIAETDERGMVVNLANKLNDTTQASGYYIWKQDMKHNFIASGTNKDIHTFGGLYEHVIDDNWDYWAEGAIQTGHRNHKDIEAYGLNSKLNYSFNDAQNTTVYLGYEYLSGDNPGTPGTYEGFDPLWGRWDRLGTLACDIYGTREGRRPAELSNMHRLGMGWHADLTEKVDLGINYHLLWVAENQVGSGITTTGAKFRGQIAELTTNYKHNKFMTSQILLELFGPGPYYADINNDITAYLRYQLVIKF
ncbi:MAG: alginate export family protein [Sedimentisphaerales bacterium]|nr:alginate export family protein [Sedimentisphaerales bacterium]